MYNILINNLSLFPMTARMNRYEMCVDEWKEKPQTERFFNGMQTNEPVTHALIRNFANEEKGEKLNMILSLRTEKVKSGKVFPQDLKEEYINTVNMLKGYLDEPEDTIRELTHYSFYEKAVIKFVMEEYAVEAEELSDDESKKKYLTDLDCVDIPNVPQPFDIQKAVVELANKIIALYDEHDKMCRLYMDYTGGDRSTSTIMIALTKMLEEREIRVDHIWAVNYDSRVKVNEIHEKLDVNYIFDFISGLQEFINYGRADKLNEYWIESGAELSEKARKVNERINDLSDSMQLCHAKNVEDNIGSLINAIIDYEKDSENSEDNMLFRYLIEDIKNNYNLLYDTQHRTVPNIVRWCLDKNMIQQAVTIYTELIPEYIVKEKILWYKNIIPGSENLRGKTEQSYYYINTYIWETLASEKNLNYSWNNDARSYKNKTEIIVDYIFDSDNNSNMTMKKNGISRQKMKDFLSNYYVFKAMIRNRINHASSRSTSLSQMLENMTFNDESKFIDKDGKYVTELTPDVVKNMMYDMLDQVNSLVAL